MSQIAWLCFRSRFPFGEPSLVGECTAPDVDAAIAQFAGRFHKPATDFARTQREFGERRTAYLVQSKASAKLPPRDPQPKKPLSPFARRFRA